MRRFNSQPVLGRMYSLMKLSSLWKIFWKEHEGDENCWLKGFPLTFLQWPSQRKCLEEAWIGIRVREGLRWIPQREACHSESEKGSGPKNLGPLPPLNPLLRNWLIPLLLIEELLSSPVCGCLMVGSQASVFQEGPLNPNPTFRPLELSKLMLLMSHRGLW